MKIVFEDVTTIKQLDGVLENPSLQLTGKLKKDPASLEQFILSDFWPKAVPDSLIVKTESAIKLRAKSIIRSFLPDLADKTFLDFGCGDGSCVHAVTESKLTLGYDIVKDEKWANSEQLTTDFKKVKASGPFDIIMMYDVFDHVPGDQLESVINRIFQVCHANTKVYVRCHPWTSIHGGHCYEKLNKAYAHLFLNDEQLAKYGSGFVRKIIRPINKYRSTWGSMFKIDKMTTHRRHADKEVDTFFEKNDLVQLINEKCKGNADWQQSVLPIEFVDFILSVDSHAGKLSA